MVGYNKNNSKVSTGREGSEKAKSNMGDNLLADGRKGDPRLYAEGKKKLPGALPINHVVPTFVIVGSLLM